MKGKLYAETMDRFCAFLFGREPAEKCFTFNGGYLWEMVGAAAQPGTGADA